MTSYSAMKTSQASPKSAPTKVWWLVLVISIVFYCYDYFFRISPSLVVSQLMHQYHTNALGIGSMAAAFYLGYTLFQIPGGILLDYLSIIPALIITIVTCLIFFVLFTLSHVFGLGLVYRFFIGMFSALSFISVLYVAKSKLNPKYFAIISGITIAVGTLAASLIQVLVAVLMRNWNWQHLYIDIALATVLLILALLITMRFIPSSSLTKTANHQLVELWPAIFSIVSKPSIILNGLIGGLYYLPTSLFANLWGITFMQQHYGLSKAKASLGITLIFAGWAVGAPIVGIMCHHIKNYRLAITISAITAGVISLIFLYSNNLSAFSIYSLLFCFGLFSATQVMVWQILNIITPAKFSGMSIAICNMLIMVVAAGGHFLVGLLLVHLKNFNSALLLLPGMFLLAAVGAWLIRLQRVTIA